MSKEELLKCARTIKENCKNGCYGCPFLSFDECILWDEGGPDKWNLPETKEAEVYCSHSPEEVAESFMQSVSAVEDQLEDKETEKQVTGRWIRKMDAYRGGYVECSVCGTPYKYIDHKEVKTCMVCHATMEENEDDE